MRACIRCSGFVVCGVPASVGQSACLAGGRVEKMVLSVRSWVHKNTCDVAPVVASKVGGNHQKHAVIC